MARKSRAGAPRRRVRKTQSTRIAQPSVHVLLRTSKREIPLSTDVSSQDAMRWTYAVRSRRRWSDSGDQAVQADEARDFLRDDLGVDDDALAHLAEAGMVEVEIPWVGREEVGWAARILPWEYLIAGATRRLRAGEPLTVVRHLAVDDRRSAPSFPKEPRVLFVASEPGPLRGLFKFDSERDLVKTHLGVTAGNWHVLDTPIPDQLRAKIVEVRPDVVHLTGFDVHLARAMLLARKEMQAAAQLDNSLGEGTRDPGALSDGYVLAGINPVRPRELGDILTAGGHRPHYVALNIGNSAARIAPLVMAQGTRAATGFQDNFDDDLAELFFSVLYSRLSQGLPLALAFEAAWKKVRSQPALGQGTGVALWSASRLVKPPSPTLTAQENKSKRVAGLEQKAIDAGEIHPRDVREWVMAAIEVSDEDINYSMLHNQRPLFRWFVLRCQKPHTIRNVRVKVSLSSGMEQAVYDRTLDIEPPFVELKRDIHVPLTSMLARSVHESVRTGILVEITWGDHVLYRDTMRVRLVPVDQWRDTDEDRKWLPSFVFPRDPAVMRLVDTAQRYMRVLRDDPAAGFDGYQSVSVRQPKTLEQVDLQVRAIWSAIVHELRLGYINPPPGYSVGLDSQRLRTPSMIVRDHSGTCIDLALFFAACLELVDIYPAIILLNDHAFPAYWRAEKFHNEFRRAHPQAIETIVRAESGLTAAANAQEEAWLLGRSTYREIVDLMNANKLVPLETVRLTENSGFSEAVDAGRDNLRVERDFQSMVDIALAREKQVTPLPILGEQA